MIRFAYLQEVYLYEVYRETLARGGEFRFPSQQNILPMLSVPETLLRKCLLGLVAQGRVEFRQDRTGARDGYEVSAAGLLYVEGQFEDYDDRPREGTPLRLALVAVYGDAGLSAVPPREKSSVGSQNVRLVDSQDAIAAIACAVAAELTESAIDIRPTSAAITSRARLLAPQMPPGLMEALVEAAVQRLTEMGYTSEQRRHFATGA